MKRILLQGVILTAVAAGGVAIGLSLERIGVSLPRQGAMVDIAPPATAALPTERRILYYKDPTTGTDFSAEPKKDAAGRDYIAVYEDEEESLDPKPAATETAKGPRRIRFYRNPMGLPDTSPVPKKDWMGMDYIPVYEDGLEETNDNTVKVSLDRVQRLGVRTEAVQRRDLMRPIRAVGTVQFDERRITVISTKFEGWIEKLRANATGETVRRGDPLMQVYSPDLLLAQEEYAALQRLMKEHESSATGTHDATRRLIDGASRRLGYLDFPADEMRRLAKGGQPGRTVTIRAPFNGVIVEKMAFEGARFMPGEPLYRIADNSQMWVIAEIFEQDLANVRVGQTADVRVDAYPDRTFTGRVAFIYPTVGRETRTARVRVEIPNPAGALKADLYANVSLAAPVGRDAIAVPDSAVINSGTRQIVLVERGEGRFEPRVVRLGAKADGYYEILEGLAGDERVVVAATFLIDAESNLQAALRAFTQPETAK